jgi:hypothetical protein
MKILPPVVVAIGTFWAAQAHSFPENIRHGYPSCVSCHVSPVGGGVLTPYGRGSSEAFISTFSKDGEGNFGYGLLSKSPEWLMVGGDQRGVAVVNQDQDNNLKTVYIPMQADIEVAIQPIAGLTIGGSIGQYGPDQLTEFRRSYIKVDVASWLSVRAGRFLVAYGVNLPDHTTSTREGLGFGEGGESYNIETAVITPWGESILTFVDGNITSFSGNSRKGYGFATDTMTGAAWRTAAYLGSNTQVGVSYLGVSNFEDYRQAYGAFAQSGVLTRGYVLVEYDRKFENSGYYDITLLKLGYEATQGLVATVQGDTLKLTREGRLGLQWWPRPHWELIGEWRRTYEDLTNGAYQDSGVVMIHHYL